MRYVSVEDEVMFRDSPDPRWRLLHQLEGARRLLAAAALALPLLAACEPERLVTQEEPTVVAPIRIEDQGASLVAEPGAGLAPQATQALDMSEPVDSMRDSGSSLMEELVEGADLGAVEAAPRVTEDVVGTRPYKRPDKPRQVVGRMAEDPLKRDVIF